MWLLLAPIGIIVLLWKLSVYQMEQREKELLRKVDVLRNDPAAVIAEVDKATAVEKLREEEWNRQNPGL